MRWRWWLGPVLLVLWSITVFAMTWSTWPPAYVSRDEVNAGVPGGVKPELVVADANTANRVSRGAVLRFTLTLWVIPIVVVCLGYGVTLAYRGRMAPRS